MKLRKFVGMAVAVLSLSLTFCGCGDKKSKSESNSETKAEAESKSEAKSDTESASSSSRTPGKFSPMVTKDAAFALGVNLNKRQAFKVVDAYLDQFCSLMQLREEDVDELKGVVSRSKKELFADVHWEFRKFLDERGLSDVDLHWAVISLEDLKVGYDVRVYGLSVAIAGDVDLEKLIPKDLIVRAGRLWGDKDQKKDASYSKNYNKKADVVSSTKKSQEDSRPQMDFVEARNRHIPSVTTNDAVVFKEMVLEGEKVWRIEPQDESILPRHELEYAGIYPHVTSLDGQLLLAASSRNALVKLIRLYRQGKDAGDTLGDFSAKAGELLHLGVDDVGERVRQNVRRSDLREIAQVMPEADEVIRRLGALEADVKVSPDGTLQTSASLKAASEKDADMIRTLAKLGLMKLRSQWSEDPYVPREFVKMLDAVKVGGTDGEIKVQNVAPLLAFWSVVSSARLNAATSAMAMNGRKLIRGIEQANMDRCSAGLAPLWPRTWQDKDASHVGDDVSARAYKSAADYFNALFDMEHYGTPNWNPVVDGELLSTLGKNAVVDGKINPAGLDWCIAANVTDETAPFLPFLVSANVNPELLYGDRFDGMDSSPLPIGPKSGAAKSMFGDQGIVVVRKGGAAETVKIRYLRYDVIYRRMSFDNSGGHHPIVWLTPTGVAVPSKGKRDAPPKKEARQWTKDK